MSDNNFHLAAALLADAADLVTTAPLGTRVRHDHAYGHLPLAATRTVANDGTHTLTLWAVDHDRLLAAVEAHQHPAAAADHTYCLVAHVGDDHWDLTIDGHTTVHLDTIDELNRHHHDTLAS
jgi:hypothetical protein